MYVGMSEWMNEWRMNEIKAGRNLKWKKDESWSPACFPQFARCCKLFSGKENLRWKVTGHVWGSQTLGIKSSGWSRGGKLGQKEKRGRDTVSVAIPLNLTRLSGAGLAMQSCPELEQRPRYLHYFTDLSNGLFSGRGCGFGQSCSL